MTAPTAIQDPELAAMASIIDTLMALEPDTRKRVMAYVDRRMAKERVSGPSFVDLAVAAIEENDNNPTAVSRIIDYVLENAPQYANRTRNQIRSSLGSALIRSPLFVSAGEGLYRLAPETNE